MPSRAIAVSTAVWHDTGSTGIAAGCLTALPHASSSTSPAGALAHRRLRGPASGCGGAWRGWLSWGITRFVMVER